jgi:hypothetical protein
VLSNLVERRALESGPKGFRRHPGLAPLVESNGHANGKTPGHGRNTTSRYTV